jgi:hypothetical protein
MGRSPVAGRRSPVAGRRSPVARRRGRRRGRGAFPPRASARRAGGDASRSGAALPIGDTRGINDLLEALKDPRAQRPPPSAATADASSPGGSVATRSPRRWEQVMPAASMNVRSPIPPATLHSQVARIRESSIRCSSPPPESEAVRGLVTLRRAGDPPPDQEPLSRPCRCSHQSVAIAGEHRRRPGTAPQADHDHHPAGTNPHVCADYGLQVGAEHACAGRDANERRGQTAHAWRRRSRNSPMASKDQRARDGSPKPVMFQAMRCRRPTR